MDIDYTVGEVELTYKSTSKSRNKIYSSEDAYEVLLSTYREGTICYKEYFKVLFLNQASQILGYTLISEGGITDTTVDVRVILQAALLTNSVAIILAHNHPSGNLKPSRQDMEITKQVKNAAQLMRITVLDHLILTDEGYCGAGFRGRAGCGHVSGGGFGGAAAQQCEEHLRFVLRRQG